MAHIFRRAAADGKITYQVRWRDAAGAYKGLTFTRKADAAAWAAKVEHELRTGAYIEPAARKITFREYAEKWRASQPHAPNTAKRNGYQLEKNVYPALGGQWLAQIRPSDVQAYIGGLAQRMAPYTVRTHHQILAAIFNAAVSDGLIPRSPARGVKLPELDDGLIVPLTVVEVRRLADTIDPQFRALILAGAGAGLRIGELGGLTVPDVDFLRRTISIDRQVQPRSHGGGWEFRPPKAGSKRVIPVGATVTDALARHLRDYPADTADRFVFTWLGTPLWAKRIWRTWQAATKAAGLPGVTPHDLRHFYASGLIAAGQSPRAVAARLGHKDPAITLRVYAHLWPDDDDRSRHAIDELFAEDAGTGVQEGYTA